LPKFIINKKENKLKPRLIFTTLTRCWFFKNKTEYTLNLSVIKRFMIRNFIEFIIK